MTQVLRFPAQTVRKVVNFCWISLQAQRKIISLMKIFQLTTDLDKKVLDSENVNLPQLDVLKVRNFNCLKENAWNNHHQSVTSNILQLMLTAQLLINLLFTITYSAMWLLLIIITSDHNNSSSLIEITSKKGQGSFQVKKINQKGLGNFIEKKNVTDCFSECQHPISRPSF